MKWWKIIIIQVNNKQKLISFKEEIRINNLL